MTKRQAPVPGGDWTAVQQAVDNPVNKLLTAWYRPWGPFGLFNAAMHIMVVLIACFPTNWAPSWPFIAVSAAMVVGFWLFAPWRGRHEAPDDAPGPRLAVRLAPWAYLVAVGAGFVYLTWWGSLATLLFFNLFAQCWVMPFRRWEGFAASVWIAGCAWLGICAHEGFRADAMLSVALQMAFACGISIVAGVWVLSAIDAAQQRSELIRQLRVAQGELAKVHQAQGARAERERLSREIHDTLAQGFTSLVVLSRSAQADLEAGDVDGVRERLALMRATAADNLTEARALVAATAPAPLRGSGLGDGIERLAAQFTAATGVPVDVSVPDAVPGDVRAQVAVLRAAGEGLANVRQHAGARQVRLSVVAPPGWLRLVLEDDGVGVPGPVLVGLEQASGGGLPGPAPGARGAGYGLAGMNGRAKELGGTLTLGTGARGQGTVLELAVPCSSAGDCAELEGDGE